MSFVHVRSEDEADSLSLDFQLNGKDYHLLRSKQEPVGKALKRIAVTVSKGGKVKKKDRPDHKNHVLVEAHLYTSALEGEEELSPKTTNQAAWVSGHTLSVSGTRFSVAVNAPAVKRLQLPGCIMATCAAVPLVDLEFADIENCRWVWRRSDTGVVLPTVFPETECSRSGTARQSLAPEESREKLSALPIVGTSFVYWPTEEDTDRVLVLECRPCNEGQEQGQPVVVASTKAVSSFNNIPMAERHLLTPCYLEEPGQFRVASYNILANVYASSEHARERLYPYCDARALEQEYRQCLLSREILGYRADVISLQEVGAKCFSQFLSPAFHHWGYEGCFHEKAGKTPEGEAIFFNRSKFSLVHKDAVVLREYVQQSPDCRDLLSLHPLILENLLKRHNILQTVFLRCTECPSRFLLVANTHLYFHPMGDHIRLLQVEISLRYLANTLQSLGERVSKDAHIAVVFCGDFNSCPCTAAYDYLLNGKVSRDHPEWQLYRMTEVPQCSCNHRSLNIIHEDGEHQIESYSTSDTSEEPTAGLDLKHSFNFSNSCGTRCATNVTLGWTGVIDYIFIDASSLNTQRVVPFPPAEQLTEHVALPSINFPSDHIALVTDLAWRTH